MAYKSWSDTAKAIHKMAPKPKKAERPISIYEQLMIEKLKRDLGKKDAKT